MQALDSLAASAPVSAPKRSSRARRATPPLTTKMAEIQQLPRWVRPLAGERQAAAFAAGAALALFDQILRGGACGADVSSAATDGGEPAFAGCLRQRLALKAAQASARLSRRREDAAALRDAEHLAMGGEASPAGRLHLLFRLLAAHPARFDAAGLARAQSLLGLSASLDVGSGAKALQSSVADAPDLLAAAARASALAMKFSAASASIEAELFAMWVADLALAIRLQWARPVPLLAGAMIHPSLKPTGVTQVSRWPNLA